MIQYRQVSQPRTYIEMDALTPSGTPKRPRVVDSPFRVYDALGCFLPAVEATPRYYRSRLTLPTESADIAYCAGLFDGEGCITRLNRWPTVSVAMTDEPVISYLGTFGGLLGTEKRSGNRKLIYRWRLVARREVAEFLWTVLPYLRVKANQAEEALLEIQGRLLIAAGEA